MFKASFEFFETVCSELNHKNSVVLTTKGFSLERVDDIFQDLKKEFNETAEEGAINEAVSALERHFSAKGAELPFEFDRETRELSPRDPEFIAFISRMSEIRSIATASREFETEVTQRLSLKLTGLIHRVGWPRGDKQRREAFLQHLKTLGFGDGVVMGREKDAGLDILWLPPVGEIPHRPVVSVQCKNSCFDLEDADRSIGPTTRSLGCHRGLQPSVHVCCVLFNDYVEPSGLGRKPFNFVPLGLSDVANLENPVETVVL
jgi:hypothetical protein